VLLAGVGMLPAVHRRIVNDAMVVLFFYAANVLLVCYFSTKLLLAGVGMLPWCAGE
jgi:hypothetical protein